jgi:hypothetical protein
MSHCVRYSHRRKSRCSVFKFDPKEQQTSRMPLPPLTTDTLEVINKTNTTTERPATLDNLTIMNTEDNTVAMVTDTVKAVAPLLTIVVVVLALAVCMCTFLRGRDLRVNCGLHEILSCPLSPRQDRPASTMEPNSSHSDTTMSKMRTSKETV